MPKFANFSLLPPFNFQLYTFPFQLYTFSFLLFSLLLLPTANIMGQTAKTWTGTTNTNWHTASNWNPSGVPQNNDPVTIPNVANDPILGQADTVASLTLQNAVPVNFGGYTLTVTGVATLANANVSNGHLKSGGISSSGATVGVKINNTAGNVVFVSSTFSKPITATGSFVILNGLTFNDTVNITKTGASTDQSPGGITANAPVTYINNGNGNFLIQSLTNDVYNGPVTIRNLAGGMIVFGRNGTTTCNGKLTINSTGGATGIGHATTQTFNINNDIEFIGSNAYVIFEKFTLQSGKKILPIAASNFSGGTFEIRNGFNQLGTDSITINGQNGARLFIQGATTTFRGVITANVPSLRLNGGVFHGKAHFTKTGNTTDQNDGSYTFMNDVKFTATAGSLILAYSNTNNTYYGNLTLENNGGELKPAYVGVHDLKANLILSGLGGISFINGGTMKFSGNTDQSITRTNILPQTFFHININKPSGDVTLGLPALTWGTLTLTSGNLITTAANLLTFHSFAVSAVSGGSASSYIDGPVAKTGNTAFTFPTGRNGQYAPVSITAPATSSTYRAEYKAEDPSPTYNRDNKHTGVQFVNRCGYWLLDRTAGTANPSVTLGWNSSPCYTNNPSSAYVTVWRNNRWETLGNGANTGNAQNGTVRTSAAVSNYNTAYTLGGVCSFTPTITASSDTLFSTYAAWYAAEPIGQLKYRFFINNVLQADSNDNIFNQASPVNGQIIKTEVTNLDGCIGLEQLTNNVVAISTPWQPASELTLDWSASNGTQNSFLPILTKTQTDNLGNVYTVGSTLNTFGNYDISISKRDSNGVELWNNSYNGTSNGNDYAADFVLDSLFNVYITGSVYQSGTDTANVATLKYSSAGNLTWVRTFNGSNVDAGVNITVKNSTGDVYVSGITTGSVPPITDFLMLKYNSSGTLQWNRTYDNGMFDVPSGHVLLANDSVVISGISQVGLTDFRLLAAKYTSNGTFVDTSLSAASNVPFYKLNAIKRLSNGNLYLSGCRNTTAGGRDMYTVALAANMSIIWSSTYNSQSAFNDEAFAIDVDAAGNTYVAGYRNISATETNYSIIKYSNTGAQLWAKNIDGGFAKNDTAKAIFANSNAIYITGNTFNGNNQDFFTIALKTDGTAIGQQVWNSWDNKNDRPSSITVDNSGAILVGGQSEKVTNLGYTTLRYMQKQITNSPRIPLNAASFGFVENRGQLLGTNQNQVSRVKFYSDKLSSGTYIMNDTISMVLFAANRDTISNLDTLQRVDLTFHNQLTGNVFSPRNKAAGHTNFYLPQVPDGREAVPEFTDVYKNNVWQKVDAQIISSQSGIAYLFIVNVGGKPEDIKLKFNGQSTLQVNANQQLAINTAIGNILWPQAKAWQISPTGGKILLPWKPTYSVSSNIVSFSNIGVYEGKSTLVIEISRDLETRATQNLVWSTFYGGTLGSEITSDVKTDEFNNSYLCGKTNASNFPVEYIFQFVERNKFDCFLVAFNPFSQRKWATIQGGTENEKFATLEINTSNTTDLSEVIFAVGVTESSNMYTNIGSNSNNYFKAAITGISDAIISRMDFEDGTIAYSTCFGGEGADEAIGVCKDTDGNFVIGGNTTSTTTSTTQNSPIDSKFPVWPNANSSSFYQPQNDGGQEIFILKMSPSNTLVSSTFFGSNGSDFLIDIQSAAHVNSGNNDIYLVGTTNKVTTSEITSIGGTKPSGQFPLYKNGSNEYFQKGSNAFISRFRNDGRLYWSTNMDGVGSFQTITGNSEGKVYVAGNIVSAAQLTCAPTNGICPICYTSNEFGENITTGNNFIGKFNNRNELIWSTSFSAYIEYTDFYCQENVQQEIPSFPDLCSSIPMKNLDMTILENDAVFLFGTMRGTESIVLMPIGGLYYDNSMYGSIGDGRFYYTDAFILGYSDINYQIYGSYFGMEATDGILNFTESAPNGGIDIAAAIASFGNSDIYIGGHSFTENGGFPFQEAPPAPDGSPTWYQTAGTGDNWDAFIARFNLNQVSLPLNFEKIENKLNSEGMFVFPNPAQNSLTIKFEASFKGSINIFDITGKVISNYNENDISEKQIFLNNLSAGIYFVSAITSKGEIFNTKFIKQ
jgi:hypothetical protein